MADSRAFDGVAIVGIGCRFPGGADTPERFWRLLCGGTSAVAEIPRNRFDLDAVFDREAGRPGKTYARWAGLVDGIDRFDAAFFGISPREASRIDPQQRLLLEVAWEALEEAGQIPERFAGSKTGVFVGISTHDYANIQCYPTNREVLDAHSNTGAANSIAANRLSYVLDLRGPSLAVDTACSSSLTAIHLACRSLTVGECDLALAGGANAILAPEVIIGYSQAMMLSPDGRCHAFDASANGFVRGEGAGIVVLKRLADALNEADRIHAVIRGSAVNQDGRTTGIMVPNGEAQQALIREALRDAGVPPSAIQYVEAHGTGTAVGDPIEANAIGSVLGVGRPPDVPCLIGSVKPHIGHLEAGAGIAGLIKAALALEHRQVPPNLNFTLPNPAIDFDALRLRVPTRLEVWPPSDGPAMAAVNSFGFGGANAHVVLEQPPEALDEGPAEDSPGGPHVLPMSARDPRALRELVQRHRDMLRTVEAPPLADICYTAATRRSHHEDRLAVVGASLHECADGLDAFLAGETHPAVSVGRPQEGPRGSEPRLAFVFPGIGPQWWAMGRRLMTSAPLFREVLEDCSRILQPVMDWSLIDELSAGQTTSRITTPCVAEVANCALQIALTELWRDWGVVPAAVVGHSAGEVGCAYAAGILSLKDALLLSFRRGQLVQRVAGTGTRTMLAAGLSASEASAVIAPYHDHVSIAAFNSPTSVTFSGGREALEHIAASLGHNNRFARFVTTEVPYHGPLMDALRDELAAAVRDLRPRAATIPIVSEVTGGWADGSDFGAEYWWRNMRQPVLFGAAIDRLIDSGIDVFVEVSPHPTLTVSITECLAARGTTGTVLPTLHRVEDERTVMLRSLAALYARGRTINWRRLYTHGQCVSLPTYPWQRERHWLESPTEAQDSVAPGHDSSHPILGRRLRSVAPTWECYLGDPGLAYVEDHRIQGAVAFPGAGYVEAFHAVAREAGFGDSVAIEDVELRKLMVLPLRKDMLLQTTYDAERRTIEVHSAAKLASPVWELHAKARLVPGRETVSLDTGAIAARCQKPFALEAGYRAQAEQGLQLGRSFRCLSDVRTGDGEALGKVTLPSHVQGAVHGYCVHPCLVDAAFQTLLCAASSINASSANGLLMVTALHRSQVHATTSVGPLWSYARLRHAEGRMDEGDVWLTDAEGHLVFSGEGLRFGFGPPRGTTRESDDSLYEFAWKETALPRPVVRARPAIPSPEEVRNDIGPLADRLARDFQTDTYYGEVEPGVNDLARAFALTTLRTLGLDEHRSRVHGLPREPLANAMGVASTQHRLFNRLLEIVLPSEGGENSRATEEHKAGLSLNPGAMANTLLLAYPEYSVLTELVSRCGQRLVDVLRGEADAREFLFTAEAVGLLEAVYEQIPSHAFYNRLGAEAVAAATRHGSQEPTVRVLEIGAGVGSTTAAALARLEPGAFEYVFTDISPFFLDRARKRFQGHPELRVARLDVEHDPATQGFDTRSFDVVLAANVLHATADLSVALHNVRRLLAPGGLLVLQELTRPSPFLDVLFGVLPGWWRFADRREKAGHPLLRRDDWRGLLEDSGFEHVAALSDPGRPGGTAETVLLARAPSAVRRWAVFADRGHIGSRVAAALEQAGDLCTLIYSGEKYHEGHDAVFQIPPDDEANLTRLFDRLRKPGLHGVLHFWSLDIPRPEDLAAPALMEAQCLGSEHVLAMVHSLAQTGVDSPEIWLVTSGAQAVGVPMSATTGGPGGLEQDGALAALNPVQAPLWGLGRVLMNEQPGSRCRLIDVSHEPTADEIAALVAELRGDDYEEELALRGRQRLAHRLVPVSLQAHERDRTREVSLETAQVRIDIGTPGILETLSIREASVSAPRAGEVTIRTMAAGLNFKDVLLALGALPPERRREADDQHVRVLGAECAGIVLACGAGVDAFQPGDEVVAFGAGEFVSRFTTGAHLVVRKPARLSLEEAVTLPAAFVTAHVGLNHLARMAAGERVLIHGASGGVGLAAVQLCQRAGVEIFATAGTSEKRAYLRSLGIKHVMDSRSLAFADEALERTHGEGVDIVLNSLAGEAIRKGLVILRPGGRFIEIGQRDILQDSPIGLRPFVRGLSFFSFEVARMVRHRPSLVSGALREIFDLVERDELQPLPHITFDLAEVAQAIRLMAQAKHIGKVVVTIRKPHYLATTHRVGDKSSICRPEGTYLITGGLGGFGVAVANWLVTQGARHLVLLSRSGVAAEDGAAARMLFESPANVVVARGDVAIEDDMARVLAMIRRTMPPLQGIVHAAMVLDDAELLRLDVERFRSVMAPKVAGAWNLHRLTRGENLDFFVLFSSVSAIGGSHWQGNYAAANAFLDAFAAYRQTLGLPALTVSWGMLAGTGYVFRHPETASYLEDVGLRGFTVEWAVHQMARLLRCDLAHVVAARIDWRQWMQRIEGSPAQRRYLHVAGQDGSPESSVATAEGPVPLLVRLQDAAADRRQQLLVDHVAQRVSKVFGGTQGRLDLGRPLTELGFDSLMAVELSQTLRAELGIELSFVRLLQGISVEGLAAAILAQLALERPESGRSAASA